MSQAIPMAFIEESEIEAVRLAVPYDQQKNLAAGGASYQSDFITQQEEAELLNAIDKENWITDLNRRVQHYGYRYDYSKRDLTEDDKIGALPDWAQKFCYKFVKDGIFTTEPNQLIVNEYEPGQGIAPHADRDCFGDVLVGLSLASDCIMDIYPNPEDRKTFLPIVLERRSLLRLAGDARHHWLHGIRPKKSDTQNGIKIPRGRRVSLTFRTVEHAD